MAAPAGASDGVYLNLASSLAATAADLQRVVSVRKGKAKDASMRDALDEVTRAVWSLCAAVGVLLAAVEDRTATTANAYAEQMRVAEVAST